MSARRIVPVVRAAAVLSAIILGGCMGQELASMWPDRPIAIDGKAPEWAGREAYYSEKDGLKVGFFNDAEYLYVYFSTWHRQTQMQILMGGMTVWLDAEGGKREVFGINYPMKRSMPASGRTSPEITPDQAFDSSNDKQERFDIMLSGARSELQIVGPAGELSAPTPAADSSATGIQAMIDISNRTLIYELRVPLAQGSNEPFVVNAGPGAIIGVGFKVGKREMPDRERMGGGPPSGMGDRPGGMGGFPGGGMGGQGGMRPGGGPGHQPLESLELWTKVKLAAGPSETSQK